jgi:hypothetical protein
MFYCAFGAGDGVGAGAGAFCVGPVVAGGEVVDAVRLSRFNA